MGSACCCLRDDFEDFAHPNASTYRNCLCVPFFLENFLHLYASLFRRGEVHALPSSNPGTASLNSTASQDDYLANMYRSPPLPLPYDADPRIFGSPRDGLVSRCERGSSHSHEENEPLRTSKADNGESESVSTKSKGVSFASEDVEKGYNSAKSSLKLATADATTGYAHIYASSEDEDVCPTCLEEYTTENPKIITKCSHHFHLGCIYEWMERSDKCPVCGKVMAFDETT